MELITPSPSLILWSIAALLVLALVVVAIVKLMYNDHLESDTRLLWFCVILFAPFFGALLYFRIGHRSGNQKKN